MKITRKYAESLVVTRHYHRFPGTSVTVCALETRNGFAAVGYSACADLAEFDEEAGVKAAFEKAMEELMMVLSFQLCEYLSLGGER